MEAKSMGLLSAHPGGGKRDRVGRVQSERTGVERRKEPSMGWNFTRGWCIPTWLTLRSIPYPGARVRSPPVWRERKARLATEKKWSSEREETKSHQSIASFASTARIQKNVARQMLRTDEDAESALMHGGTLARRIERNREMLHGCASPGLCLTSLQRELRGLRNASTSP